MAGGISYLDFAKWITREKWFWRQDLDYWYKDENGQWPPAKTATDEELLKIYFG